MWGWQREIRVVRSEVVENKEMGSRVNVGSGNRAS